MRTLVAAALVLALGAGLLSLLRNFRRGLFDARYRTIHRRDDPTAFWALSIASFAVLFLAAAGLFFVILFRQA